MKKLTTKQITHFTQKIKPEKHFKNFLTHTHTHTNTIFIFISNLTILNFALESFCLHPSREVETKTLSLVSLIVILKILLLFCKYSTNLI